MTPANRSAQRTHVTPPTALDTRGEGGRSPLHQPIRAERTHSYRHSDAVWLSSGIGASDWSAQPPIIAQSQWDESFYWSGSHWDHHLLIQTSAITQHLL